MAWTEAELDYNVFPTYVYPVKVFRRATTVFDGAPPPGAFFTAEFISVSLRKRQRRKVDTSSAPVFFGPPFVPSDFPHVATPSPLARLARQRFSQFPEYPVPYLLRPCEVEVLQIPNNPYARLRRNAIKAIIYMRTTYVGDPTC